MVLPPLAPTAPADNSEPLATAAWTGPIPYPIRPAAVTLTHLRNQRLQWRERQVTLSEQLAQDHAAAARDASLPATQRAVGAWGVVTATFMKGVHAAALQSARGVDSLAEQATSSMFRKRFAGLLQQTEGRCELITSFSCRAVHGGVATVAGTAFITTTHLCFASSSGNVRFAETWASVVGISEAVSLDTYGSNGPATRGRPFLIPKPAPHVVCDSLLVFLGDRRLVELTHVVMATMDYAADMTNVEVRTMPPTALAYSAIYDVWENTVAAVPIPGVSYGSASEAPSPTPAPAQQREAQTTAGSAASVGEPLGETAFETSTPPAPQRDDSVGADNTPLEQVDASLF